MEECFPDINRAALIIKLKKPFEVGMKNDI